MFFQEPGARTPFGSEDRGLVAPSWAARPSLPQAFVLQEGTSPRIATPGGAVAPALGRQRGLAKWAICRFDRKVLNQPTAGGRDGCCRCVYPVVILGDKKS